MTARLLFVDDEPRILEAIENMLFDRDDWELHFATSGHEALGLLATEPAFDVLVTDMRMPSMDGLQLLQTVNRDYPGVMRIVLSGHAELEKAMQAITIAHLYLAKPCDEKQLIASIECALHIGRVVVDDELRQNLGRISDAPRATSLQRIYQLVTSDKSSIGDIARAVAGDIGLATKVLQAANSAVFGQGSVSTVAGAVQRVGLDGVRAMTQALDVLSRIPARTKGRSGVVTSERTSLRVAALASALTTVQAESELAYLCGLLHDLGTHALLLNLPERTRRCHARWRAGETSLLEAEQAEFGIDHAQLGAAILELFRMDDVAAVVRHHHVPSRAERPARLDALGALHIAEVACHGATGGTLDLDPVFMEQLGPMAEVTAFRARQLARGTS